MKRWTCDRCNTGTNAPARPRHDDVRRYCLPCSESTGRLVERRCPALERERAKRAARAAAKRRACAQRARAARPTHGGVVIDDEARAVWKLMDEFHGGAPLPAIKIRRSKDNETYVTGVAYGGHRLVLTIHGGAPTSSVLWVLAHELAHCATAGHGHDRVWADCYVKAVRARYGPEHFSGVRAASGYAVDRYVQPALERYWSALTKDLAE